MQWCSGAGLQNANLLEKAVFGVPVPTKGKVKLRPLLTTSLNMKDFYTLDDAVGAYATRTAAPVAGIYGLVDEAEPGRVRYVGSTGDFAHRLYAHWHSSSARKRTPKHEWLRSLREGRGRLALRVLEFCDVGPRQSRVRMEKENAHIARLSPDGMCDLNVALTPVGHQNSLDSRGKLIWQELRELRAENQRLRALLYGEIA